MEEEIKAPVTETVEEVKDAVAAAEETEVKETAEAAAEETEVSPAPAEEPAESMADYEAEIDASLRRYEKDEKVKCTVISVDVDKVMVELGSTTGIIRKQDASDDPSYNLQENIKPGDEIEATVLRSDDGHGHVVLSMKAAAAAKAWDRLTSLLESKDSVEVKITGVTKAGVITMLEGVRGFIPASKLSLRQGDPEREGSTGAQGCSGACQGRPCHGRRCRDDQGLWRICQPGQGRDRTSACIPDQPEAYQDSF